LAAWEGMKRLQKKGVNFMSTQKSQHSIETDLVELEQQLKKDYPDIDYIINIYREYIDSIPIKEVKISIGFF
jgi:hypothetical protein